MSVADSIANAIVTGVQALALVPNADVVRRKVPTLPVDTDPPQIVVTVQDEGFTQYLDFEGDVFVLYPCAVTLITGGGSNLADDPTLRTWRQQVRKKLDDRATFASVTEFHNVVSDGLLPFNPAALAKDLNYSVQLFTVTALESRT